MRVPTSLALAGVLLALLAAGLGLGRFGVPDTRASAHVARYYLEHAYEDAHTPNVVTAMIGDYRSFDTLGETIVVFAAGLACALLLVRRGTPARVPLLLHRKVNLIAEVVTRLMLPAVQIFALYVIFHGHYSPGGGFQGGALLAASILLGRIVLGWSRSQPVLRSVLARPLGAAGVAVFAGVGLVGFAAGGAFLEYDAMPFGLAPDMLRYWGILGVELGVALAVTGALVSIFDDLSVGGR